MGILQNGSQRACLQTQVGRSADSYRSRCKKRCTMLCILTPTSPKLSLSLDYHNISVAGARQLSFGGFCRSFISISFISKPANPFVVLHGVPKLLKST